MLLLRCRGNIKAKLKSIDLVRLIGSEILPFIRNQ